MSDNPELEGKAAACARSPDVPAYCLGEMPAAERDAFKIHLQTCAACAEALASATRVIDWLKASPPQECSPDLTARVMSQIGTDAVQPGPSAQTAASRSAWRRTGWLARAAGILLLAGLGTLFLLRAGNRPGGGAVRLEPRAAGLLSPPGKPGAAAARSEALQWLAKAQGADGGWTSGDRGIREGYAVGVSALALMALMSAEPSGPRGDHAAAIRRGIEHLIAQQNDGGLFGSECSGAPYNQGLATLAMLDACSMETNTAWQASARRAVGCLQSLQDASGGWSYLRGGPGEVNTSASIWPLVALIRADRLGFPDVRPHVERGLMWLRSTVDPEGLMGYHRAGEAPGGRETLTAAGAVCFLKAGDAAERQLARLMLPAIRGAAARSGKPMDYYETFFITEALALAKDASATEWVADVGEKLRADQTRSGQGAGSWAAPDPWSDVGGPVYSTSMAALTLRWN